MHFVTTVAAAQWSCQRHNENGSIQMCLQEIWETVGIDALRVVASCAHDAKWALRS